MMACRGVRGRCFIANSWSKSVSTREAWNGEILYADEGNSMLSNQTDRWDGSEETRNEFCIINCGVIFQCYA